MNNNYDLKEIPKVTLHEHIEGSVTPELAQKLASRNNIEFPKELIMEEGTYDKSEFPFGRYAYDEKNFMEFVTTYDKVASFIQTPKDYYDVTYDYLERNAKIGVIYCEFILYVEHMATKSPNGNENFDSNRYFEMLNAIISAADAVEKEYGLITRYIATGVRHLPPNRMQETAEFILNNPHEYVIGFGIASNEREKTFYDYELTHQLIEKSHLQKSYHAGEICGPESISAALDCGAKRIGHGIASIKDDKLIERLIKEDVCLEICPTSNKILVTELEYDINNHPLRKIYDKGVKISLNPDDAGMFGNISHVEYKIAKNNFGFLRTELLDISLNAIESAFINGEIKKSLIEKIYTTFNDEDIAELGFLIEKTENENLRKRLIRRKKEAINYI